MDEFSKAREGKYGRRSMCRSCDAAQSRRYYGENREACAAQSRRYYEENREAIAARTRRYYEENREAISAIAKIRESRDRANFSSPDNRTGRWSQFEDDYLLDSWASPVKDASIALNRTAAAVRNRRHKLRKLHPERIPS